jgi:hypothetical protein
MYSLCSNSFHPIQENVSYVPGSVWDTLKKAEIFFILPMERPI